MRLAECVAFLCSYLPEQNRPRSHRSSSHSPTSASVLRVDIGATRIAYGDERLTVRFPTPMIRRACSHLLVELHLRRARKWIARRKDLPCRKVGRRLVRLKACPALVLLHKRIGTSVQAGARAHGRGIISSTRRRQRDRRVRRYLLVKVEGVGLVRALAPHVLQRQGLC